MKQLRIIHLGVGNVGSKLVNQIRKQQQAIANSYGVQLQYCGLFDSKGGYYKQDGLAFSELEAVQKSMKQGKRPHTISDVLSDVPLPFVLIDTTNTENTIPALKQALKKGGYAVLSNKKPLAQSQEIFDELHMVGKHRFFYETAIGAGLPVIRTLKYLLETGDEVLEIQGCFSGTLGFLFSELEKGHAFSKAVLQAKELGFIEPEPRDDLNGVDVARKVLIFARILGRKMELSDIALKSLYPLEMDVLTKDDFLNRLPELDEHYKKEESQARKENKVLRYVAHMTEKTYKVGMEAVAMNSELGKLKGPDNLIIFRTKRYNEYPMVIKGPGAGGEVTAAGVFGDILEVVKIL